jgi:hypothetical protein
MLVGPPLSGYIEKHRRGARTTAEQDHPEHRVTPHIPIGLPWLGLSLPGTAGMLLTG